MKLENLIERIKTNAPLSLQAIEAVLDHSEFISDLLKDKCLPNNLFEIHKLIRLRFGHNYMIDLSNKYGIGGSGYRAAFIIAQAIMELQISKRVEALTHKQSPELPRANGKPILDKENRRFKIKENAKWITVTEKQNEILSALFEARGAWVSGKLFKRTRPDKIIKSMPKSIQGAIESHRMHGYRIPALLP